MTRLVEFSGDDAQYIKYLEQLVLDCRSEHEGHTSAQNAHPNISSAIAQSVHDRSHASLQIPLGDELEILSWEEPPTGAVVEKRWQKKARELVRTAPKARMWRQCLQDAGILDAMNSGRATIFMLQLNGQSAVHEAPPESRAAMALALTRHQTGLIRDLEAYARIAVEREKTACLALVLANFQKFLLLSACAVVHEVADHSNNILDIVRICLGDKTDRYCVRALRAVKFVNRLAYTMDAHGWKNRTSELLLMCTKCSLERRIAHSTNCCEPGNKDVPWYLALADSPNQSLDYLKKKLSSKEFTSAVAVDGSPYGFHIPSLVHQILAKKVELVFQACNSVNTRSNSSSVFQIGQILGYENVHSFQQSNPWQIFEEM